MSRSLLALALLAVLVAGCASSPAASPPPPSPATAAGPVRLPWATDTCRFMVVFLRAPPAAVQPFLPAGFGATNSVGFEVHDCKSVQGLDGTVAPGGYGALWGAVSPPKAMAAPDAGGVAYFKWHVLVPDAPRRELLVAHGVPADGGSASVVPGPAPGTWTGTMELAGVGTFTGTLAALPATGAGDLPFQEFTNATGGVADWRATTTHDTQAQGAGTWSVPVGSVLAKMVGASSGTALITTGVWSYDGGSIALP